MNSLWGFIKKEILQTLRDPRMAILLFGVPVIQLMVFGLAISNEVKKGKTRSFKRSAPVMGVLVVYSLAAAHLEYVSTKVCW